MKAGEKTFENTETSKKNTIDDNCVIFILSVYTKYGSRRKYCRTDRKQRRK